MIRDTLLIIDDSELDRAILNEIFKNPVSYTHLRLLTETDLDGYRAFFAEYPAL